MKIGLGLMFVKPAPFKPDVVAALAQVAEQLGFESIWVPEHIVIPVNYQTRYPYSPTGKLPNNDEQDDWPNPLMPLAYAAALTTKIKLGTCITILPEHHPLYVAKEFATLDALSNGRAILGIGSGWLREEFEALGLDWRTRGARTDESIQALRALWREHPSSFKGKHFSFDAVNSFPKPVQKGGVPIFVGGTSAPAARRAARLGDGFFPVGNLEELDAAFRAMRAECDRIGRDPDEIELMAGSGDMSKFGTRAVPDWVKRYEDMGVSRVLLPIAYMGLEFTRAGLLRDLGKAAQAIISRN